MNETTHTPGPWIFSETNVGGAEYGYGIYTEESGYTLCSVPVKRGGDTDYERDGARQIANARLIAAAPELLAALDDLLEVIKDEADGAPSIQMAVALTFAENAIAKARGEAVTT